MSEKKGRETFVGVESLEILSELQEVRSAIEKMAQIETVMVSQSDNLKYQIAALSEALIEVERRLTALESHKGWVLPLALQVGTVVSILVILWIAGVLT